MRARYLGNHDSVILWGIQFPRGVFVEVTDAHAQRKLAGNREFEVETIDAEEVTFVETLRAEIPAEVVAEAADPTERQKRPYNRRK